MSWTTLVFITFYVEINLGLKFLFELVVFQIWKVQILSNDKMTKIKVVNIYDLYNFDFHLRSFGVSKLF